MNPQQSMASFEPIPHAESPEISLAHPTHQEAVRIWSSTSSMWAEALSPSAYLEEQQQLSGVGGRMTTWILTSSALAPDARPILSSCETFRKRAVARLPSGKIQDIIVHGVASVFCPEEYRGKGYAVRLMRELAKALRKWQVADGEQCVGSILYSDIGLKYYAKLGWHPVSPSVNSHVELPPASLADKWPADALPLCEQAEMDNLCSMDAANLKELLLSPSSEGQPAPRIAFIFDMETRLWHHAKATFATRHLFNKSPTSWGAIAGPMGSPSQVWAMWTHRYYQPPASTVPSDTRTDSDNENTLYILRLAVGSDHTASRLPADADKRPPPELYAELLAGFKAVMQAARVEARKWGLGRVRVWNPTPLAREFMSKLAMEAKEVERQQEHIASLMWYEDGDEAEQNAAEVSKTQQPARPLWVNCEYYVWV